MNIKEDKRMAALKEAHCVATHSQIAGGPAFPHVDRMGDIAITFGGMTLRDYYFAAKALNAILSQQDGGIDGYEPNAMVAVDPVITAAEIWAKNAYEIADAMIKERAK